MLVSNEQVLFLSLVEYPSRGRAPCVPWVRFDKVRGLIGVFKGLGVGLSVENMGSLSFPFSGQVLRVSFYSPLPVI